MSEHPRFSFTASLRHHLGSFVQLTPIQTEQLEKHFSLLLRWNERLNLTAVRRPEEIVVRHYCESLFFAAKCPARAGSRIADIGSGAGFPGVPFAVLRPDCEVTLIESNQRKAVFLRESSRMLGNVAVEALRAEDVDTRFDWIVSRAVAPEAVLLQVPRLAERVGLLIAEGDLGRFTWNIKFRVPWSDHTYAVFHVPRET